MLDSFGSEGMKFTSFGFQWESHPYLNNVKSETNDIHADMVQISKTA